MSNTVKFQYIQDADYSIHYDNKKNFVNKTLSNTTNVVQFQYAIDADYSCHYGESEFFVNRVLPSTTGIANFQYIQEGDVQSSYKLWENPNNEVLPPTHTVVSFEYRQDEDKANWYLMKRYLSFILSDNTYKKWNDGWVDYSTKLPTAEQFESAGMESYILDRIIEPVDYAMSKDQHNECIFKQKISLAAGGPIRSIAVK